MPKLSRQALIQAAKQAAQDSSVPLTLKEFVRRTGISEWFIERFFPKGRWSELRTLAGIRRGKVGPLGFSDDDLLAEFHRVVTEEGQIPTWRVYSAKAKHGCDRGNRSHLGEQ
jgi:hypothetical protein